MFIACHIGGALCVKVKWYTFSGRILLVCVFSIQGHSFAIKIFFPQLRVTILSSLKGAL